MWYYDINSRVERFVDNMAIPGCPGRYYYTYGHDIRYPKYKGYLGSTIYAAKILYSLGFEKSSRAAATAKIIENYADQNYVYDDVIHNKSKTRNFISSLRHARYNNLFNQFYKIAETRQALSIYEKIENRSLNVTPSIPLTRVDITKYLKKFDWTKPWGAGSHLSHLIFFLKHLNNLEIIDDERFWQLINHIDLFAVSIRNEDGSWGNAPPCSRESINGAMKIITGLEVLESREIGREQLLIDSCLTLVSQEHACDKFNVVYVLSILNARLNSSYRYEEICEFMHEMLRKYEKHFFCEIGGFSFHEVDCNDYYYGAKIAEKSHAPDLHGTVLFCWGLHHIFKTLNIQTHQFPIEPKS